MSLTNQQVQDEIVGHEIDLQFYANGIVRDVSAQVNEDDDDLFALLLAALLLLSIEDYTPARADAAIAGALDVNRKTFAKVNAALEQRMRDVTSAEARFQESLLQRARDVVPRTLDVVSQGATVVSTPLVGVTVADTVAGLSDARATAIRRAVHAGYAAGRTAAQIVADIRGTRAAAFTDGVIQAMRQSLETVIRSTIAHASTLTAQAFYLLNGDLSGGQVIWLSVLDGRTSPGCIARAGKLYTADASHRPIGHPWPWEAGPGRRHYNCRSTFAPLVPGERPPPSENSYNAWLRRQPASKQDEVLGKARGVLYRKGTAPVEKYVNNKGRWITLDDLNARGKNT